MTENDIQRTARDMVRQHGTEASARAWAEADKSLTVWDIDGFHAWKRVMLAIGGLQTPRHA